MSSSTSSPAATVLLAEARHLTDAILGDWASRLEREIPGANGAALGYALRGPGKRVRPALLISAYRAVGGRQDAIAGVAAAVEAVHTYSLVHDDLPCMDDDDYRRGRATTHRQFDVATATRIGFLLVPVAARMLVGGVEALGLGPETLGRMASVLFRASGAEGMVGGQWLDLAAEQRVVELPELTAIHRGKTGALIRAACELGGMAGEGKPEAIRALSAYGDEIGVAFQIADDVLDCTGTSAQLGKTAGRDEALAKSTYVRLLGIERAREEALVLADRAVARLDAAGLPSSALAALADYIVTRNS